ncbi:MAG: elongation factor G [Bacteroidales bacterium]|nr:elongation factor G [Bacteroidales bacterium]MBO7180758.1 elongation factor G [Bacteroidales bacterium]MBO7228730.1 elongation factor G [Bacteroidales bacterium]MBQ1191203.1 elongation factor G [Bacteroidales bacterium]MBQ2304261.1 elongation factor G [Bacteroidales bacterium]
MKIYHTSEIKNIALMGGAKSGKTTLAEAMAFEGNTISRRGSVEEKNTVSDYRDIEIERKSSVSSSLLYAEYNNKKINIIDVPGYADYQGELVASLHVAETAVVVINSQIGVEVGTEIAFRHTSRLAIPLMFAMNQLDHEKSNFDEQIRELKEFFGEKITIVQYPINQGPGFNCFIDLIMQKMYKYPAGGGKPEILDIPEEEKERAEELRLALVENAASGSDDLMEKYFDNGDLAIDEVRRGLRLGMAARNVFPVLCVSGKENIGVGRLMEFITFNVPSPTEALHAKTLVSGEKITFNEAAPTTLFVFKTANETHVGNIVYMKVMSGELAEGMDVVNSTNEGKERIAQIFVNSGKTRTKIEKAAAGDIISTIKLKDVSTNDTLTSTKNIGDRLNEIKFPEPIYTTAIKAVDSADDEKLGMVLNEYASNDCSLKVEIARELKQTIISAMGEYHVNTLKWYLDNVYKIPVELFAPKIPYRETITKSAEASYRHKKQSGGAGQFGEVFMMIEPYYEDMPQQKKYPIRNTETVDLPWGGKLVFNTCIVGGAIDARFMPAILKGIMEKMEEGPLTGSYARDIVVNVFDGKMHPVDSNEMAFKLAGRNAFKEAFKNAGPKILEPIYDMEVTVPSELMGGVMTDLQSRRAIVMGMDSEGMNTIIKAKVPLAEMYRYSTALSSITSGRAVFSMQFAEYEAVPTDVQSKLLKTYEELMKDED